MSPSQVFFKMPFRNHIFCRAGNHQSLSSLKQPAPALVNVFYLDISKLFLQTISLPYPDIFDRCTEL